MHSSSSCLIPGSPWQLIGSFFALPVSASASYGVLKYALQSACFSGAGTMQPLRSQVLVPPVHATSLEALPEPSVKPEPCARYESAFVLVLAVYLLRVPPCTCLRFLLPGSVML